MGTCFVMKESILTSKKTVSLSFFLPAKIVNLRLKDTWERYSCTEIMKLLLINKIISWAIQTTHIKSSSLIPLWSKMGKLTDNSINVAKIHIICEQSYFPKQLFSNFYVYQNHLESPLKIHMFRCHHKESESQKTEKIEG